jgi:hypothetical protein
MAACLSSEIRLPATWSFGRLWPAGGRSAMSCAGFAEQDKYTRRRYQNWRSHRNGRNGRKAEGPLSSRQPTSSIGAKPTRDPPGIDVSGRSQERRDSLDTGTPTPWLVMTAASSPTDLSSLPCQRGVRRSQRNKHAHLLSTTRVASEDGLEESRATSSGLCPRAQQRRDDEAGYSLRTARAASSCTLFRSPGRIRPR